MISKEHILDKLKETLEPRNYVYAMWLEGSDANGGVDEYSDVDLWIDIEDKYLSEVIKITEQTLNKISSIDYKYYKENNKNFIQNIYHIDNTSKYLIWDIQFQYHSRDMNGYKYVDNSKIENAKVIFDKCNRIEFKNFNINEYKGKIKSALSNIKYRYEQHIRITKYINRKNYLESLYAYQEYVIDPLIQLLRIKYTPTNIDYGMCHISNHLPKDIINRLEQLEKITSLEDIKNNIMVAKSWYEELIKEIGTSML